MRNVVTFCGYKDQKDAIITHLQDNRRVEDPEKPEAGATWEKTVGTDHYFHAIALNMLSRRIHEHSYTIAQPQIRTTPMLLAAQSLLGVAFLSRLRRYQYADGRMVLTADPSHCLLLYPLDEWEPIQARLMALSSFNERIRSLQRLLVGHAHRLQANIQDGVGQATVLLNRLEAAG